MNCLNDPPCTHLAATRRLTTRLGNFAAVDVLCPLGCGQRILIVRVKRSSEDAIDTALRSHYKFDCPELKGARQKVS